MLDGNFWLEIAPLSKKFADGGRLRLHHARLRTSSTNYSSFNMKNRIFRPVASLALVLALASTIICSETVHAQLGRGFLAPVSATQFEEMLRGCGLADTVKDTALPLHEAYFARFREFEERELEPTIEQSTSNPHDLLRTVEDAKKDASVRRRLLQRAAQIDGQLVDELVGLLVADDALRAEKLRNALSRRRSAALTPGIGLSGRPDTFDIGAVLGGMNLDIDVRARLAPTLDVYDAELTRLLERLAEAVIDGTVRAAELREERGLAMTPEAAPPTATDGADAEGATPADTPYLENSWFRQMHEIRREARADVSAAEIRIRRLHRDTIAQLELFLTPSNSRALREKLYSAVYPRMRGMNGFKAAVAEAEAMRAKGKIDDAQWLSALAIIDGHDVSERPLTNALMDLADERAEGQDETWIMVESKPKDPATDRGEMLARELQSLADLDADLLRAAVGLDSAQSRISRTIESSEVGAIFGSALGTAVGEMVVSAQAVMVGADGEMVVLSGDDFSNGDITLFDGFNGGDSVVRPMDADQLDTLAKRLGFDSETRVLFDEIVARCAEARIAAEKEHENAAPKFQQLNDDGSVQMSFALTTEGGAVIGGGNTAKLADAVDVAEEKMFDDLKATAATDRADEAEVARRMRARARLLVGERGARAVDLVAIVDAAQLDETARAALADELSAWDEASVPLLRAMRAEVAVLAKERDAIIAEATKVVTTADGLGETSVNQMIEITGDASERMQRIDIRVSAAEAKVAEANKRSLDALTSALETNESARKAVRRGFLRAANPTIYRYPRDLAPFFAKALALEGVGPQAKADIERLRDDWIENREARCELFINERDAEANATNASATEAFAGDPMRGVTRMQTFARERKRLRGDLEQAEATSYRKLQDILIIEVGAEKAKGIGELPAKAPAARMIQFGGQ